LSAATGKLHANYTDTYSPAFAIFLGRATARQEATARQAKDLSDEWDKIVPTTVISKAD
jgi:hypothetical protein